MKRFIQQKAVSGTRAACSGVLSFLLVLRANERQQTKKDNFFHPSFFKDC